MSENIAHPRVSFNAQVAGLNSGESCAKVRALDPTMTVADLPDEMPAIRQQVRNATMSAVSRARESTGNQYGIQVGEAVMPDGSIYIVAIVTRKD
jgi:hypothetical protein